MMDTVGTAGSFAPHSSASIAFARAARPACPKRCLGASASGGSWWWTVTTVTIGCPVRFNIATRADFPLENLREVQDLGKDFPEVGEVVQFVERFAPLLAGAMKLRGQDLKLREFRQRALQLKLEIKATAYSPAQHPGIQKIQNIFRKQATRLYHWAKNPAIPADNNRAERELRPLVIARKISFGSQSEQGARTREILMSVLHTLRKRTDDYFGAFKRALDALAEDETRDPYKLLFDSS